MGWLYLILGGVFEVGFTTCLRYIDGFRNWPWTLAFVACIACSLYLLDMAVKTIPLGTAYAVWSGIGAMGTVAVGMLFYGEPATLVRGVLIVVLVASILGLKMTSGH